MAEHEYRLVWTFHHIVLEGWSAVLVLRDVEALLRVAVGASEPIPLADAPALSRLHPVAAAAGPVAGRGVLAARRSRASARPRR